MPELLMQWATSLSNDAQLANLATAVREQCAQTHADKARHVSECPECLPKIMSALRSRYFDAQHQPQAHEWFTQRPAFVAELDNLLSDLEARRIDPAAVDARIRDERARWYADTVRTVLIRLMVEDLDGRRAASDKIMDPPADPVSLLREVSAILGASPVFSSSVGPPENGDVGERLLAATSPEARTDILSEAFFGASESERRYLEMLRQSGGSSIEQVVDRILEDRQAATASRGQADKLKARLIELNRGRAGLQKKKEQKKAVLSVPDELYDELPPCAVCGKVPETRHFRSCPLCIILVGSKAQEKPVVYCAEHNQLPLPHEPPHSCASGDECVSIPENLVGGGPDFPDSLQFCRECLDSHRLPSLWCSLACAATNFQRHREEVHLPGRAKLGLTVSDSDQLEYLQEDAAAAADGDGRSSRRYRARDISAHVVGFREAVKEWEERSHVKMEMKT